jgi:hypothetical protein
MSQMTSLVIYDGAATPVIHTLIPVSVTKESGKITALLREDLSGVPMNAQVSLTMTLQKLPSGVFKAEERYVIPTMESIGGQNAAGYTAAPKVAFEDTIVVTGFFHERSTTDSRRRVRQLAVNGVGGVATSVVPDSTGIAQELFDQLIAPN